MDSSLEDSLEELIFIVAFILNPYIIAIAVSKYPTLSLDMLFHYYSKYILLSLIHISEPTRHLRTSYAVFCLKKKKLQI
ncbi:hypothetical protein IBD95_09275 [Francisella tularensis]|nr:hypothetical protein [Francisella tularensis]